MVAYILAILIEWPTMGIIKLIFPKAKAKNGNRGINNDKADDAKVEMNSKELPTSDVNTSTTIHSSTKSTSPNNYEKLSPKDLNNINHAYNEDEVDEKSTTM